MTIIQYLQRVVTFQAFFVFKSCPVAYAKITSVAADPSIKYTVQANVTREYQEQPKYTSGAFQLFQQAIDLN